MKNKGTVATAVILAITLVITILAGINFHNKRTFVEDVIPGPGVTDTFKLSKYNKNLEGTVNDSTVYVLKGKEEGGSILIMGGTHANENAAHMAAIVMLENLVPEKGTVYIIPNINNSALTHNDPLDGSPQFMHFTTASGETRTFHYGSRATNPIDQWPDPDVYTHTSGQTLSGSETRNLNRCYPGVENGTISEKVGFAVTSMIKDLKIDMEFDLHESSPEYAVNNAAVVHQRALTIGSDAVLSLEIDDIQLSLEQSPVSLHGLTHRELGDATDTYAVLLEVGNPSQGRFRGYTDEALALTGKDPCYVLAQKLSLLYVDYSAGEYPIELRVARHCVSVQYFIDAYNSFQKKNGVEGRDLSVGGFPDYFEMVESRDLGLYLK